MFAAPKHEPNNHHSLMQYMLFMFSSLFIDFLRSTVDSTWNLSESTRKLVQCARNECAAVGEVQTIDGGSDRKIHSVHGISIRMNEPVVSQTMTTVEATATRKANER